MIADAIVIGSGPTGVSAAKALLSKGHSVLMLDVGYKLDNSIASRVQEIRSTPVKLWDEDLWSPISSSVKLDSGGIPEKLVFGSDFPFRAPPHLKCSYKGVSAHISHAFGGLSNAWGANIMPLEEKDFDGWPFGAKDLAPYYKRVVSDLFVSARRDLLDEIYPFYEGKETHPLRLSQQAELLLRDMEKSKDALIQSGIFFGQARLAVKAGLGEGKGCIYCGKCLYGCPYGYIYTSSSAVESLKEEDNFTYAPGYFVEKIEESGEVCRIHCRRLRSESKEAFFARKVFVGAGSIASTRMILESAGIFNEAIEIKESQYFLLPVLRLKGVRNVSNEPLHTLAQLSIDILDSSISPHLIHILVYTYNDLYDRALQNALRLLPNIIFKPLSGIILSRLMAFQGYLHSDDSPSFFAELLPPQNNTRKLLLYAEEHNGRNREVVNKVLRKLFSHFNAFKMLPIFPSLYLGAPGKSYHAGGSFPMVPEGKASDMPYYSDHLGRPLGYKNVHLVDASCFPSVSATNVTLTAMANSYRIAEMAE
ncbi:MAG: GMC family oxidoreductase [Candidatus Dadabacteria bacterium]|nr:MAG: GMC family oxidoreductase [Candidatus Dadabacteria bacterium]